MSATSKTPLELAAESPDPAVRGLALRRRNLEVEIQKIEGFFSIYGSVADAAPPTPVGEGAIPRGSLHLPVPPGAKSPKPVSRPQRQPPAVQRKSSAAFIEAVTTVLTESERPMQLTELYDAVIRKVPALTLTTESFRQKMLVNRERFPLAAGGGYALTAES